MKFCLGILSFSLALALVKCEEIPKELEKTYEECGKEIGVNLAELLKSPPNFDDPKTKCFSACFFKKEAALVDGKVVIEKSIELAAKVMPKGVTDAIKADITECAKKANAEKDECEVAGAFEKCVMEKLPPQ